jgi:ADP-ribose pyrophosphatase YjhB (NUDIX family)
MSTMQYCPRCGSKLSTKLEGGRERPACLTDGCGFIHFGDSSIGCGAVVIHDGRALLIQRGIEPGRGTWQIPGGYVENDEEIHTAVEREVLEEAGVVARVRDVIGFRHAVGRIERPVSNIYVVFRLDYESGEPQFDGDETQAAGFFDLNVVAGIERVQGLSLWAIRQALATERNAGFSQDLRDPTLGRPGWSLFGFGLDGA